MSTIGLTIFGLTALLALTSLLPPLASRMRLPYSVLLAIVGCGLGLISTAQPLAHRAVFDDFIIALRHLDISAETFLYVFLPALLFETALSINVRRLLDDITPIMAMAVVAVVICTVVTGFFLSAVSPFSLLACLMLGAIVATTDPAAVVAIFREIGAPRRLTILVEGESLLNDAAAIAIYVLLLGALLEGRPINAFAAIGQFLFSFIGGAVSGYLLGRFTATLFALVRGWPTAEITLTISLAYLSFLLPEHYLHVSGVVACVAAGLTIGSVGRTRMSPKTFEQLDGAWGQLGFWSNSLIFLLAAMLIPQTMRDLTWRDVVLILALYGATLVARGITVFGVLPLLRGINRNGDIGGGMKAVMWWGGMRGAVSLALALAVTENPSIDPQLRRFIATSVTGFVLLTLFINGTSLRLLMHGLRLNQLTARQRAVKDRSLAMAVEEIRNRIVDIADRERIDREVIDEVAGDYSHQVTVNQAEQDKRGDLSAEDLLSVGLTVLSAQEDERYYNNFKAQIMTRHIAERLLAQTARLRDAVRAKASEGYLSAVEESLRLTRRFRFALRLHQITGIDRPLAAALADRFEVLLNQRIVLTELIAFARRRLTPLIGTEAVTAVIDLISDRLVKVSAALQALKLQYPDYALELQRRYLGRIARQMELDSYEDLAQQAMIGGEVLSELLLDTKRRWSGLDERPRLDTELTATQLIARVPMFHNLSAAVQAEIAHLLHPRLVIPDEVIVRAGERGDAMYFIASGAVTVKLPGRSVELGSGDFFGELALLRGQPRNADVVALGFCKLLVLSARDLQPLLARDRQLRERIESVAAERLGTALSRN
ncbi:cation:proton antiporter [Dongia soli]|uniref:Cation:proton antiporter n=1 Tax=Dongia soli TaxID=600628 RepID=A0ABU5E712_9PROT|nr:cation:proton antiporter [Dongia soli]MDY0882102.1 cation:proton antiporter [Dongia soli]